mgnify:CR=1 FL=1
MSRIWGIIKGRSRLLALSGSNVFAITKEGFLDEKNSFCNIRGSAFH